MNTDREIWLNHTRKVSRKFIEDNFSDEESLFDAFWQAFCFKVDEIFKADASGQLVANSSSNVITNLSFVKDCAVDMVTPIIVTTVAEVMRKISSKSYSSEQLKDVISKTAAQFGAAPGLTACLARSLPKLCIDILTCDPYAEQAAVSKSPRSEYQIWVNEISNQIVGSIDFYEKKKNDYPFWIDMGARTNYSHIAKGKHIGQIAAKLLRCLVESLGSRIPISEILVQVFNDKDIDKNIDKDTPADIKNRIERQLSNLESYSDGKFRNYLLDQKFTQGIGLKKDFKNKYFLYQQLITANHD